MSAFSRLVVITVWISTVQARDETLIHGWRAEPRDRGTWSILWSCLATIFICTWSALHLKVPQRHPVWYLLLRKIGWMLIAATAPEMILFNAADNFFEAQALSKHSKRLGKPKWTLTHTQFAFAGGFWTITSQGVKAKCKPDRLRELVEGGLYEEPPITEEELKARGKGDWEIKLIAVLQIVWFVVQTLFRAIQRYQITSLEIMTVAFVFCSVFIYGFCLNQPQGVDYPVFMDIPEAPLGYDELAQKSHAGVKAHASIRANAALSYGPGSHRSLPNLKIASIQSDSPEHRKSNASQEGNSSSVHSRLGNGQSAPITKFSESNLVGTTPTTYDMSQRRAAKLDAITEKRGSDQVTPSREATQQILPFKKVNAGLPNIYVPPWTAEIAPAILFILFACGFGALHCLAWNSPFPTFKERLAWHICCAATTAIPALMTLCFALMAALGVEIDHDEDTVGKLWVSFVALLVVSYIIGRITLIVLAFMTLRALPADAFQTVDWNQYIPHFAT